MTESKVVERICNLPINFRAGNKSPLALVQESGYLDYPKLLTRNAIISCLLARPELLQAWEGWSEDQRYSPAWVFRAEKDLSRVWRHPSGPDMTFRDVTEACAEFIVRMMDEHFAKYTPKR